tara:strand:- start:2199 stop:2351 length:153 start_codon:yes stop_codon:yes gene_type:complete
MPAHKNKMKKNDKNKKKNNRDKKQSVSSDFVQREKEMNQSPGGRLDVRVH